MAKAKKTTPKKKAPAKKPAKKAAAKKAPIKMIPAQPGPAVPPAAKPKAHEAPLDAEHLVAGGVLLGRVEDYFAHVGVVALTLQAPLSVGDMIRVKGHTTDITQKVDSIQINHLPVQTASPKDAVGIRIADRARKGDALYKI